MSRYRFLCQPLVTASNMVRLNIATRLNDVRCRLRLGLARPPAIATRLRTPSTAYIRASTSSCASFHATTPSHFPRGVPPAGDRHRSTPWTLLNKSRTLCFHYDGAVTGAEIEQHLREWAKELNPTYDVIDSVLDQRPSITELGQKWPHRIIVEFSHQEVVDRMIQSEDTEEDDEDGYPDEDAGGTSFSLTDEIRLTKLHQEKHLTQLRKFLPTKNLKNCNFKDPSTTAITGNVKSSNSIK